MHRPIVLTILVLVTLVTSCKKDCHENEDAYHALKPEMLSSIPYQEGQTINFDSGGEIHSFAVTRTRDTIIYSSAACIPCCVDTLFTFEEQLNVELYDSTHHVRFDFNARGPSQAMYIDVYPFTSGQHANASSTLRYVVDTLGTYVCNMDTTISVNGSICHDTITIGSTLYNDVVEIRHQHGWVYDTKKVFYSQDKGILKVTFRNNAIDEFILVE